MTRHYDQLSGYEPPQSWKQVGIYASYYCVKCQEVISRKSGNVWYRVTFTGSLQCSKCVPENEKP